MRRDRARRLRRTAIEAEKRLWLHLRHRLPLEGTSFGRRVPLGPYFADVCRLALKTVVDFDGDQDGHPHALAYDDVGIASLEAQGFTVLRFREHRAFRDTDAVLDTVAAAITRHTSGSSSG